MKRRGCVAGHVRSHTPQRQKHSPHCRQRCHFAYSRHHRASSLLPSRLAQNGRVQSAGVDEGWGRRGSRCPTRLGALTVEGKGEMPMSPQAPFLFAAIRVARTFCGEGRNGSFDIIVPWPEHCELRFRQARCRPKSDGVLLVEKYECDGSETTYIRVMAIYNHH